jgi:hypothetical protein
VWRERLKTGLIVVLLTGLIWFFADQADMDAKTISLRLTVQPPDSSFIVISQDPEPLQFDVTLTAPRGVISDLDKEFGARPLSLAFLLGKFDKQARYARLSFESIKVLSQLDGIRKRGLTITSVRPATFSVEIDAMIHRPMRIKPEFGEMVVEADAPKPATVDVILPSRMVEELAGDTLAVDATRYADPSKPDTWQTSRVELQWPGAGPQAKLVHFEPATFDIRFKLKDTTTPRTFQSVQVAFSVAPDVLSRYTPAPVEPAEFHPDITVTGPKQLIDNLRKEDIKLVVEVYSSDEASVGRPEPISRKITIQSLPPNVQVATQLRDVRFTLREKGGVAGS